MSKQTDTSFVSIIMPVYNDAGRIADAINSLLEQDYPKNKYEIIIVDNGSTDNTKEIAQKFLVTVISENNIQSSYAARNKGLKYAKGDVIAFLDSDCIADSQWLIAGVEALDSDRADLAGGKVKFRFSLKPNAAEYYDAINNIQIKEAIETRKIAYTANLFVRRSIFDEVGIFSGHLTSGGDVEFTHRATKKGFKLVFADNAIVKHPTRNYKQLFEKSFRVGFGKAGTLRKKSKDLGVIGHNTALARLKPWRTKKKLTENNYRVSFFVFVEIVVLSFLILAVNIYGLLYGLLKKPVKA